MKILFFAGALRKESLNKKFVKEAKRLIDEKGGHTTEFLDLADYPMPVYDGDIEASSGVPETAKKLGAKIKEADALIISSPEYNGAIASSFKNVIDWLSRDKPVSLEYKPLLLLAASPGALGGVRGLWHTRVPLEVVKAHVFPDMQGLPSADKAFGADGKLTDEKTVKRLSTLTQQFIDHVAKA